MALIFTTHALRRMGPHGILVRDVREALRAPMMVEDYPDNVPYPSRLVLGWAGTRPLHIVIANEPPFGDPDHEDQQAVATSRDGRATRILDDSRRGRAFAIPCHAGIRQREDVDQPRISAAPTLTSGCA
jgi:Domain of unknown function (DUF4258)